MQNRIFNRPLAPRRPAIALGLALVLTTSTLGAQDTITITGKSPRPVAHAAQRREPIVIDGRIDEAAWKAAEPITNFHQQLPDEGKAPAERTELRIMYDASAIYVSARMFDSQGGAAVRKLLVRRDQLLDDNASDKIALVLDPYHDRQTRVWFELNPLGVKGDHLNGDASYDPCVGGRGAHRLAGMVGRVPHSALAAALPARLRTDVGPSDLAHARSPQ
jgi:hypothetical protein